MGTLVCDYDLAVDVVRAGLSVCALAEFGEPAHVGQSRQWTLMKGSRLYRALLATAYVSQNFAYSNNDFHYALALDVHKAFKPLKPEEDSFLVIAGRVMALLDGEKRLFKSSSHNGAVKLYDLSANIVLAEVRQALYERHGEPLKDFCRETEHQFRAMQGQEMVRLLLEQWEDVARLR